MLDEAISRNEEIVAALLAALADGDDDACATLLEARKAALAALEAALAQAGPSGRAGRLPRLEALVAADRDLRAAAGTALARAGEAFRARAGQAPTAPGEPRPACLDRRA